MNNKPYSSKKWRGTLEELKLGLKSHEPLTQQMLTLKITLLNKKRWQMLTFFKYFSVPYCYYQYICI